MRGNIYYLVRSTRLIGRECDPRAEEKLKMQRKQIGIRVDDISSVKRYVQCNLLPIILHHAIPPQVSYSANINSLSESNALFSPAAHN